jgi:exonuclease SbcC
MLITRIELQNIKSYSDNVVTFTAGTNAICGENGAGKSTLLESIGFTLFDYLPYTQADFVREGEKTATVAVSFVSNQDGREYQVVRRCGGSSDYYVYDPELDTKIVASKADVADWLREHLGVEPTADLTALFRDAVGVPQGLLTAPFLQTASQRKPLFDRLLRVDEYEQVWKALRETLRHLEDKLARHRESMAAFEAQVQRLPGLRKRAEAMGADVVRIENQVAELRTELDEAIARRDVLETTNKEMDNLTQRVEMLTTRLEGLVQQLATAEKAVNEAEKAQATVEASRPGYEAYETARIALSEMEEERRARDKLRDDQASQETARELARERVKGLEANLLEVEEAEAHIETLQPQLEQQTEWEEALKSNQEQVRLLDLAEKQLSERQGQLSELSRRLATVEAGLAQADRVDAELRLARTQLEETRDSRTGLSSEQAALAAGISRLAEQSQALEITEAPNCPVCEQPLTPEHRADLLARNRAQLEKLRAQDQGLVEEIAAASETCSKLEQTIQDLEAQLRSLPRMADKQELLGQIAGLEGKLADTGAELERLKESRDQVAHLERELAKLGDPRRQYERLAEKAGQRRGIEEQLEAERHAVGTLEALLAEIQEALAPHADLDQRLAEAQAALSEHEEEHRRYLEHARIAAALPDRREQAETLRAQSDECTVERGSIQNQLAEIAAGFDPDAFAAARQREAELQTAHAGLEGQLGGLRGQVAETEREIQELEAVEQALAAEVAAQARHQAMLELAEFIREVIRQAGPYVTRRLMQQVSLEAARLFADVMADHTARLRWENNYEIVLEKGGRDRSFLQLSGGEQMAAALSIRLALLRELSAIDVAFFDEPTSNLDDARRDSLAEQILSVKGFSQLFVISHDDTFERATHHIVRVRKEDGMSQVEVQ